MMSAVIVFFFTSILSFYIIGRLKERYKFLDAGLLRNVYFYHVALSLVYYAYILFNPSDSRAYYRKVIYGYRGDNWIDYYGTSTTFIEWIAYPFIEYLGLSFEGSMVLFSFFGFLGFVYFYVFFRENVRFKHSFMGMDFLTLIFFLPNLHFWSASLGKGSVIFLGFGLFFYGISKVRTRILAVAIGGFIIYHVRPHIMLVVLVSSAVGFIFSTKGVSTFWRVVFITGASIAFFFIYQDVLSLVGIQEDEFLTEGMDLTHRAKELTKATSGVDITSYSLPMQLFTFLYRPLFIDAPGALGLIVSFENVFYLLVTLQLLISSGGLRYLLTGDFLVKSAFLSFITISLALAQIAGNLGLAMRQKSQVMILLLFVAIAYLDQKKYYQYQALKRRRRVLEKNVTAKE
jgi:hypothetical protein